MKNHVLGIAAILAIAAPAVPVAALQLVSERVDGMSRVCSYPRSSAAVSSGSASSREYRVGLGQNCPAFFPRVDPAVPAPPTARLTSEGLNAQARVCTYEEAGQVWTLQVAVSRPCPIAAGLVETDPSRRPNPTIGNEPR